MKLEERLRELAIAVEMLKDGAGMLRGALLRDKRAHSEKEKLITEALFKVNGATQIIKRLQISAEMKQKRKRGLGA